MSSLILCHFCLNYTNDCINIIESELDQLGDIICRHLTLKIDDAGLDVCQSCVDRVVGFDEFYKIVTENQKHLRNIPPVIIFDDEASDKISHSITIGKYASINDGHSLPNHNINASEIDTAADVDDNMSCNTVEAEDENDNNDNNYIKYSATPPNDSNWKHKISEFQEFPTELVRDNKLIFRGQALINLIQKFYTLSCDQCPKEKQTAERFTSLDKMIKHYAEMHNMKGYVICCDMKLIKQRAMALHMARHLQPDAFKCQICNKILTCPKILQNHVQNHLPEEKRPLACPECPRRFSYSSALVAHIIIHQPESERASHICTECNKTFVSAGRLTTHMNVAHMHHGQQYICPKCLKRFACRSNLNYHMTTHQQKFRQVQCDRCGKWLKNKLCLKKHMVQHSSIRYNCTVCSYSALNQQCLQNHIKVKHCSEKTYKCSHCDKSFKLKNTLISHMVQHSGIRRYTCEFCQRAFASSGNFYTHRKRMHPQQLLELLERREQEECRLRATQQASKQ